MAVQFRNIAPWPLWILLAVSSPAPCQGFDSDEDGPALSRWAFTTSLGVSSWDALQDLDPEAGGGFNSVGWNIDFGAHRGVTHWGPAEVLLGADFGLFGTEGDIPALRGDFTQRGLYLTPSAKFRYGERARTYLDLELGIGWYKVDIVELNCSSYGCSDYNEPFDSDELGAYVGVTAGLGPWFIVGLRAHMADFGEVSGLGADAGELTGPIYTLNIGAAWGGG